MKPCHVKWLTGLALSPICLASTMADETNVYQNQVVNDQVTVQSDDTLRVSNVTVSQTGDLELFASDYIVIPSGFCVELGGTLQIDITRPYVIRFDYDASGNMTERRYDAYQD